MHCKLYICRWFGHSREYYATRAMRLTRGGFWQMRPVTYVRCRRCGVGGDGCYEQSPRERFVEWCRGVVSMIEDTKVEPPEDDGLPF